MAELTADDVVIGGFVLLGSSGFDIESGATCSVLTLLDGVDVRAEIGGSRVVTIPYAEIVGVDIADKTTVTGGGYIGVGSGLLGIAQAQVEAKLLNRLTTKTHIKTDVTIAARAGELHLRHDAIVADDLRRWLSSLFTRARAAGYPHGPERNSQHSDLERLAELRAKGLLTDEEFELARQRAAQRLIDGS